MQSILNVVLVAAAGFNATCIWNSAACAHGVDGDPPVAFTDCTEQSFEDTESFAVALDDLDQDGDLDAVVANLAYPGEVDRNTVWHNDGQGNYILAQEMPVSQSNNVALGDADNDGDMDIFFADSLEVTLWLNGGDGLFSFSGRLCSFTQSPCSNNYGIALGDLNADGHLDCVCVGGNSGGRSFVLFGSGVNGKFEESQDLGFDNSYDVALGDLDADGDLDLVIANSEQPNTIWINNGGTFEDSGQALDADATSFGVAMGDLDQDGDLDLVFSNPLGRSAVWINDGEGTFTSPFPPEKGPGQGSYAVALGDVDEDDDLDAMITKYQQPNEVWLNEGNGSFTDSGLRLGNSNSYDVALGDLDDDGDLDAMITNLGQPNTVWINGSCESCIGDIDGDEKVDAADLGLLTGAWSTDGSTVEGSDINGDGMVDAGDLGLLIGAWGPCN